MERIRDSRRASCSSSSNSSTGLPFKSRPTSHTNEEDGQVGLLKETVRLRDRAARKERERERLRELLNRGKRKRRRLNGDKLLALPNNGGIVDPVDDCQIDSTTLFRHCDSKALQPKASGLSSPPILCVHVPRKPRSVGNRREGKSWRSIQFDAKSKRQTVQPTVFESKMSPLLGENEIEIEIAEVLYGLKKQHSPSNEPPIHGLEKVPLKNEEKHSVSDQDCRVGNASKVHAVEMSTLQAIAISMDTSSELLTGDLRIHNDEKAVVKQETSTVQEESLVCSKSARNCAELAASELVSAVAVETKNNQPGKFLIDLMEPPPTELSYEADGVERLSSDPKIVHKDVVVSLEIVKGAEFQSFQREDLMDAAKETQKMVTKGEFHSHGLENLDQTNSKIKQKLNASIQSAQLSLSPVPLQLTRSSTCPLEGTNILPIRDENCRSFTSVKPLDCLPTQSRPKRCATHYYIACNIYRHQQALAMKSSCPEIANQSLSFRTKHNNFSDLLSEVRTSENPPKERLLDGNLNSAKDEGQDIKSYSGNNGGQTNYFRTADTVKNTAEKHLASHQIPMPLLAGQRTAGSFILPLGQNQTLIANQPAFSISASSTGNVRFSYPNGAPFLAVLPSNVRVNPLSNGENMQSTSGGKIPPQRMHFIDGKLHPSQIFVPIQIQQQKNHLFTTQAVASVTDVRTSSSQRNWNSQSLFPVQFPNVAFMPSAAGPGGEYISKNGEKRHSLSSFASAPSNQYGRDTNLNFSVAQNPAVQSFSDKTRLGSQPIPAVHGMKQRTYQIPQKIKGPCGGESTDTNGERKLVMSASDTATWVRQSSSIFKPSSTISPPSASTGSAISDTSPTTLNCKVPISVQDALSAGIHYSKSSHVSAPQNKPTSVQLQNQQQQILQAMAASQLKVGPNVNNFAAKLSNDFSLLSGHLFDRSSSSCSSKSRTSDIKQASEVFPASASPFCNSTLHSLPQQKLAVPQSQIQISFGTNP